jgi:hypothetical protein
MQSMRQLVTAYWTAQRCNMPLIASDLLGQIKGRMAGAEHITLAGPSKLEDAPLHLRQYPARIVPFPHD